MKVQSKENIIAEIEKIVERIRNSSSIDWAFSLTFIEDNVDRPADVYKSHAGSYYLIAQSAATLIADLRYKECKDLSEEEFHSLVSDSIGFLQYLLQDNIVVGNEIDVRDEGWN